MKGILLVPAFLHQLKGKIVKLAWTQTPAAGMNLAVAGWDDRSGYHLWTNPTILSCRNEKNELQCLHLGAEQRTDL